MLDIRKRDNYFFVLGVLVAVFLVIFINIVSGKANYGMEGDEVFSYISATSEGGFKEICFLADQSWYDADYFNKALTATGSERFNVGMVVDNQAMDTHPPFYYLFLNVVCSIFAGKYSQWYGVGLNIFFMIGVGVGLFLLLDYFIKNRYLSLFLSGVFCCSFFAVNMVLFIRMYVLLMAVVLFQSWYHLKLYEEMKNAEEFSLKKKWKQYGVLALLTLMGGMTHYYFFVYQALISGLFVVALWILKKYRDIFRYIGVMAVSAVVYVVLYPASLTHMFFKYRGQEAVHKFLKESSLFGEVSLMFQELNSQVFKGWLLWVLLVLVIATVVLLWKRKLAYAVLGKRMLLGLPAFIYFFGISKASQFISIRYVSPVVPLIYAVVVIWTCYLVKALNLKKGFLAAVTAILVVLTCFSVIYFFDEPIKQSYFSERRSVVEAASREIDYCVYITGDEYNWKMWEDYINYPVFEGLFFIDGRTQSVINDEKLLAQPRLLFYVDKALDLEEIYEYLHKYFPSQSMEVKYETQYTYILF